MMDILATLFTGVLSGGATGLLGVLIQRWFDHKNRQQDIELVNLNHQNAIALANIESEKAKEVAKTRASADVTMAETDFAARETEADSRSLVASLEADKTSYLDPGAQKRDGLAGAFVTILMALVDFIRGVLRPGMTIYLCAVVTEMFLWVKDLADKYGVRLTPDQIMQLMMQIIATILYVFTTAALWWFGTRPPKKQGDK